MFFRVSPCASITVEKQLLMDPLCLAMCECGKSFSMKLQKYEGQNLLAIFKGFSKLSHFHVQFFILIAMFKFCTI